MERDYVAPTDILFRDPSLAYAYEATVLGLPVNFRTNSRRVLKMIGDGYRLRATTHEVEGEQLDGTEPAPRPFVLHVQIVVYDGAPTSSDRAAIRHICPDPYRVLVHGPGGMAVVDPLRREALIYACDGLVSDRAKFRSEFLEAATLALATHFDRQPLHAAAIGNRGRTLLLMGPSGAGKSTLAYLARSAGFVVLSEDMVWAQLEPSLKIWSMPRAIHLLDGARSHFPELESEPVSLQSNGKLKMRLQLERDGEMSSPGDDVVICVLRPRCPFASVDALTTSELQHTLLLDPDSGFDRYPERRAACIRALSANGGWRLSLSDNAHEALPLLRELLRWSPRSSASR